MQSHAAHATGDRVATAIQTDIERLALRTRVTVCYLPEQQRICLQFLTSGAALYYWSEPETGALVAQLLQGYAQRQPKARVAVWRGGST
jgi:alpha-mannosidase